MDQSPENRRRCDWEEDLPDNVVIYRGGRYGSCRFVVKEELFNEKFK